jgi:Ion channel
MSPRRAFARALFDGLQIIWPVLSGLVVIVVGVGILVGWMEGWGLWKGIYFAFITALTIGYGDLAPTRHLTQALAVMLGFTGVTMTALLAGVAVRAFRTTGNDEREP